jgi:hypothetical protein
VQRFLNAADPREIDAGSASQLQDASRALEELLFFVEGLIGGRPLSGLPRAIARRAHLLARALSLASEAQRVRRTPRGEAVRLLSAWLVLHPPSGEERR